MSFVLLGQQYSTEGSRGNLAHLLQHRCQELRGDRRRDEMVILLPIGGLDIAVVVERGESRRDRLVCQSLSPLMQGAWHFNMLGRSRYVPKGLNIRVMSVISSGDEQEIPQNGGASAELGGKRKVSRRGPRTRLTRRFKCACSSLKGGGRGVGAVCDRAELQTATVPTLVLGS